MTAPWTDLDKDELIRRLVDECERAARSVRRWDADPAHLRAWAHRIETGFAPNGNNLVALSLESSATAGREYLDRDTDNRSPEQVRLDLYAKHGKMAP